MKKLTLGTLAFVMALGLAACSSEENEGVDVEQAADNAGDMMDDAGDSMEETYEEATGQDEGALGELQEGAENAMDEMEDAADDAGDSMEEGYEEMTQ
ncbi:MAG: hypothetical protein EP339_11045 [Gammaproteobacteria bacterium]|uniref:Lipoprotein n=1 Tax=Marinobacter nitratireducens TaxID=1137280 RepID=A0A072N3B5_9GAMM|nr:hypothetical protein [Marinobacter nitratireducens]KEF31458.1 hypothetical protein D777_01807 [Marinobacter nitratireducens]TNE74233.1 MAG: hypothetical protein EP339_11045 [Gammaproteobacteria bacterium]TNF00881.1 MAG: hypothetical protein EP328_00705 [Gammaproteobacteria bacterium]